MAESQGTHLPLLGKGWHATSMSDIYLWNAGRPHQHLLPSKQCVNVSKRHTQEMGCKQAEVSGVQALLWVSGRAAEAQRSSQREPGCVEEKSQWGKDMQSLPASVLAPDGKRSERKKEDEVEGLA